MPTQTLREQVRALREVMPPSRWPGELAGALENIATQLEKLEERIDELEARADQPDWRERR